MARSMVKNKCNAGIARTKTTDTYIANLDAVLEIIAYAGTVYNDLECKDKKELLRQMVNVLPVPKKKKPTKM